MTEQEKNTEEVIFDAAEEVFIEKDLMAPVCRRLLRKRVSIKPYSIITIAPKKNFLKPFSKGFSVFLYLKLWHSWNLIFRFLKKLKSLFIKRNIRFHECHNF